MQYIICITLFFALVSQLVAEPRICQLTPASQAALRNAAMGSFNNLRIFEQPLYAGEWQITNAQDKTVKLEDLTDKAAFLNLWASWCTPCRQELPAIANLAMNSTQQKFSIFAANIDNMPKDKIKELFTKMGINNLVAYRDIDGKLFSLLRGKSLAFGLPVSLLFDKHHCLVGAVNGAAPWNSPQAHEMLKLVSNLP